MNVGLGVLQSDRNNLLLPPVLFVLVLIARSRHPSLLMSPQAIPPSFAPPKFKPVVAATLVKVWLYVLAEIANMHISNIRGARIKIVGW